MGEPVEKADKPAEVKSEVIDEKERLRIERIKRLEPYMWKKGWRKGTGNPYGTITTKGFQAREKIQGLSKLAVDHLELLLTRDDVKDHIRLGAITEVLDRTWGKAPQANLNVNISALDKLSSDGRNALIGAIQALISERSGTDPALGHAEGGGEAGAGETEVLELLPGDGTAEPA